MKKKVLFAILICGLVLTTACGKKDNKDNKKDNDRTEVKEPIANTDSNVIAEANIDGLKISNVSLITEGESSTYTADVVNTTDQAIDVKSFNILLKDENGNVIITLLGYVGTTITPGNSSTISTSVDIDLTGVKSIEYVRNY